MIMSKALIVSNTREEIDGHNGGLLVSGDQKLREKKRNTQGGAHTRGNTNYIFIILKGLSGEMIHSQNKGKAC